MPFDGSGNFTRTDGARSGADLFVQQRTADLDVTDALFDAHQNDIVNGMELAFLRDGQNTPTADLPMNSRKFTGMGNGSAATDSATLGQVNSASGQYVGPSGVGGTPNAITLTPTTPITAYAAGLQFRFAVEATNTGAATVAISGLSARAIAKGGSTVLEAGDLTVGAMVLVIYDGARFQLLSGAGGAFAVKDVGDTITSLQGTDLFVVSDDSETNDANAKITAANLKSYVLGDANNIRVLTQAAYDALTPTAGTIYFSTG